MSNLTPDPGSSAAMWLEQARQLVASLQARVASFDIDAAVLSADLDQLAALLADAKAATPRQEEQTLAARVEALSAQLEAQASQNAAFTSLMVHEIRKPMTSIRGYSDMLAKPGLIGPLNDMQQQFVNTIRNNIINMESLVANISDLNKLTAGRVQLENKMTTFGQIILDVQKQIEPVAQEFGNSITYDVPQGLPILITDAKQLAKVIIHLMRNAVCYTPKGGQVLLRAEKTQDDKLRISITDTGVGMTPEESAHLGEPFYRADNPLVTQYKGYGLGVPVAMRFLALMNSQLVYQSEPEKGTTASFVLEGMS